MSVRLALVICHLILQSNIKTNLVESFLVEQSQESEQSVPNVPTCLLFAS